MSIRHAITLQEFDTLQQRDFENGATLGVIRNALKRLAAVEAKCAGMEDILRVVEWESEMSTTFYGGDTEEACPYCGHRKSRGHKTNCALAAALAADKEAPPCANSPSSPEQEAGC